jgi:hypothetical protein
MSAAVEAAAKRKRGIALMQRLGAFKVDSALEASRRAEEMEEAMQQKAEEEEARKHIKRGKDGVAEAGIFNVFSSSLANRV